MIPQNIWAVVLPSNWGKIKYTTENGAWFETQQELLDHIIDTDCIDDILAVTSNCFDKKKGERVYHTYSAGEVIEWTSELIDDRQLEIKYQRRSKK
tara:strand:+ start:161 stop:448 length:288 start_codon:yes stop_codon:yes gene_type:complete